MWTCAEQQDYIVFGMHHVGLQVLPAADTWFLGRTSWACHSLLHDRRWPQHSLCVVGGADTGRISAAAMGHACQLSAFTPCDVYV
jgi:hypothetical protein